jgi:TPR repeat protein
MQIPGWATAAALFFMASALDAHAEYVRCTSKDGRSSVLRRDKCDSPDEIRTPVQPKAALPAGAAAAANAANDPMAAYKAGDYVRARELFEPRARAGDPIAQIMMGDIYKNGRGVPKDEHIAYTWTRMAADQGDARGQATLAALMQAGRGTPRDEAGALIWLQKSANQGYVIAQLALGYAYRVGLGTPKDEAMAVLWLRKAAAQGNTDATDMLREMGR